MALKQLGASGSGVTVDGVSATAFKAWGRNDRGQLGDGTLDDNLVPTTTDADTSNILRMASAWNSKTIFITKSDTAYVCGSNTDDQAGISGGANNFVTFTEITVNGSNIVTASGGFQVSMTVDGNGDIFSAGTSTSGILGQGSGVTSSTTFQSVADITNITGASVGNSRATACSQTDFYWWGLSLLGSTTNFSPVNLDTLPGWSNFEQHFSGTCSDIRTGNEHLVFIDGDGNVGTVSNTNNYGQAGGGQAVSTGTGGGAPGDRPQTELPIAATPSRIETGASKIEVSGDNTYVLKDGQIFGCGNGAYNTLGPDAVNESTSLASFINPDLILIDSNSHWKDIKSGNTFLIAHKNDDTLWFIGTSNYGAEGNGTAVSNTDIFIQIGVVAYSSYAVITDSVYAIPTT